MLNVAYDNRGGKFDDVMAPCNCPATLSTNISYIAIEPSLRLAPFGSSFYIFAGPTVSFNVTKHLLIHRKSNQISAETGVIYAKRYFQHRQAPVSIFLFLLRPDLHK